ncbi:hypothetical protein, partial [uncultured Nostoc sp.]|uniref:hypothetical protein n=1 Tax=uncultured Nostoc sp. TaxID=340711 RepID=UPI0035C9B6C6
SVKQSVFLSTKLDALTLLNIGSRDTMNDYLKTLEFFGSKTLNWSEFRALLSLQIFLVLKHGCNSRAMFSQLDHQELMKIFEDYGINIEQRFRRIQVDYYYILRTHRVSVHLKGEERFTAQKSELPIF